MLLSTAALQHQHSLDHLPWRLQSNHHTARRHLPHLASQQLSQVPPQVAAMSLARCGRQQVPKLVFNRSRLQKDPIWLVWRRPRVRLVYGVHQQDQLQHQISLVPATLHQTQLQHRASQRPWVMVWMICLDRLSCDIESTQITRCGNQRTSPRLIAMRCLFWSSAPKTLHECLLDHRPSLPATQMPFC